ncbi:MAG: AMMECR1 family protein [Candidatus Obscuribacterales bacterium]|nr:AMMECR1 family protein [Candidatus Obscuribacterales bacterium]
MKLRATPFAALIACNLISQDVNAEQTSSNLGNQSPSFARIVIKESDYHRPSNEKTKSTGEFTSLPEIARLTMYRYYGLKCNKYEQSTQIKTGSSPTNTDPLSSSPASADLTSAGPASKYLASSPKAKKLSSAALIDKTSEEHKSIFSVLDKLNLEPKFKQAAGVFVTLSTKGKTRACWGSVYPREANIPREVVLATLGALSKDYRFKPISSAELKNLKVQVTVIKSLEAVSNIKMINPFKDGVMVRSGGRGGVILPGEAIDAHYEFVLARLKAGIQPNEPCQIYKIRAEIYD